MLRLLVAVLMAAPLLGGCFLLETPCGRVAGSICTIPGEEGACTALKDIARDNDLAQKTCEKIEPVAAAYAKDPTSLVQKTKWLGSRAVLAGAGLVGGLGTKSTEKKLEEAGRKMGEAAEEAGEAVGDAIEAIIED